MHKGWLSLSILSLVSAPALANGTLNRADTAASNLPGDLVGKAVRVASGSSNGLTWTAKNAIIGMTPTSDVLPGSPPNNIGGGNPIFKPSANKAGTVALIMDYGLDAQNNPILFICSGSVVGGGMSIATAAHCVSDGAGTANPLKTTAYFFKGNPDERTPFQTGGVAIDVTRYMVNPGYTGEVIDQNDIAVLRLKSAAPTFATRYDLYTGTTDLTGTNFNVAGYGTRSTVGGAAGNVAPAGARTGFLREGDNRYEYAWGDPRFQGFFTTRDVGGQFDGQNFFGFAEVEYSFVSDFDNGTTTNDTGRRTANALGLGLIGNANFNNTGVGAREVGVAGGDSGGPGFVDGKLASINSYGLSFGIGDCVAGLNSSCGEFSGYVPVFIHKDFINAAMAVPEPSNWAMLIAGFGLTGAAMRRRRNAVVAAR